MYDRMGHNAFEGGMGGGGGFNAEDIFSQFGDIFGGALVAVVVSNNAHVVDPTFATSWN